MATPAEISDEDFIDFVEQDYGVDLDLNANDYGTGVSVSSIDTADLIDFEPDDDDIRSQEAPECRIFECMLAKNKNTKVLTIYSVIFLSFHFYRFFFFFFLQNSRYDVI